MSELYSIQTARRRFIRISGWVLCGLGLIGSVMFWATAFNAEEIARATMKVREMELSEQGRHITDRREFEEVIGKISEYNLIAGCLLGGLGIAMAICGFLLGLFRYPLTVAGTLLVLYVLVSVPILSLMLKTPGFQPLPLLWRVGMIYFLSHIFYVAMKHANEPEPGPVEGAA